MRSRITIIDDEAAPVVTELGNGRATVFLGPVEHTGPIDRLLDTFSTVADRLSGLVVDELLGTLPVQVEPAEPDSTVAHLRRIQAPTIDPTAAAIEEISAAGWHHVSFDTHHAHGWQVEAIRSGGLDGIEELPELGHGVEGVGQGSGEWGRLRAFGATPSLAVQTALVMAQAYPAPSGAVA